MFVQVHNHTEFSALDGLSTCREAAQRAAADGNPALAVTDHGMCSAHPAHQKACDNAGIKPLFGIEAYFQPDRLIRPGAGDKEAQKRLLSGSHLILLAQGDRGLHDLWAASTEAFATGFYSKPRMDWDLLEEHGGDLIATTSCLGGIISQDLLAGRCEQAFNTLDRLRAIFPGRLYLEVQANGLPEQGRLNQMLAAIGEKLALPLVAACDAHYPGEEDAALHRLWMACQSGKQNDAYWNFSSMLPESRTRQVLLSHGLDPKVVDQAVAATVEIAGRCDARIGGYADPPVFTPGGRASDDARHLRGLCERNWHKVPGTSECRDRMESEFALVADKGLAGCYLIVEDIVSWARGQGILVGPGRGSAAGSLMSYLLGITSVDPLKAGLLFGRFLTPGRKALPDFDLDFPSSRRAMITDYVVRKYGEDHVVKVGTVLRYKAKGILNKLFSVLGDSLPGTAPADAQQIAAVIDDAEAGSAGLGVPWDDIMAEQAIQPFLQRYQPVFDVAADLYGRVHAYGQHPAGLIISPGRPLAGTMPMRLTTGTDRLLVSQFDFRAAEDLGLLKLDLLTIRTLDTLQACIELVGRRTGRRHDPRSWDAEHGDPVVYEAIGRGETAGMFQIETRLCTSYATRMAPASLGDLADLTTMIRPGPRNSGATESYMRRRAGAEEVSYPHPLLAGHLKRSQGVMLYQEDILTAVRVLGGYGDLEADQVRKIVGKKLTDKIEAAGKEFVERCVARGHDREQIAHLWEQIAEHGKYSFNRCATGDTKIKLASSSQHSDGEIDLATLWRRLHTPLLPPEPSGRAASGRPKYQGPCVVCDANEPGKRTRGACNACYVWQQKFTDPKRGLYGLSYYADGRIRPARIVDVIAQGRRDVWKITLKDGKSITSTGNHRHLTNAGYRRVDELSAGDCLIIDGGYEKDRYDPSRHRLTRGERQQDGLVNGSFGESNYGFVDGGGAFWRRWRETHPKICAQCGTAEGRIELAHLDGDHAHNAEGNLAWLCASCHKAYDYAHNDRRRRWQKGHLSEAVPVESIEYEGAQETYDVVMDAPHNFVANGIVTHNSHGYSYGTLSYWTAWFKVHYPVEFLTAVLSTIGDMDRMAGYAMEARRLGITVLPPDARFCGAGFTAEGLSIIYGLSSIYGVGPAAVAKITRGQPYTSLEDFRQRARVNAGVLYALARSGALDALVPSRRGLVTAIEADRDGSAARCIHKDEHALGPGGLPCTYDWGSEPQPPPRISPATGRQLKVYVKPPPKRCTIACRRYTPPGGKGMDVPEYSPAGLYRMDTDTFGTWMSGAVFGQLGDQLRAQAREVALAVQGAPPGTYPLAAVYGGSRTALTRAGNTMWWAELVTEVGSLRLAVFQPWRDSDPDLPALLSALRPGHLVGCQITKRSYEVPGQGPRMGWRLADIWPLR